jgi:hypothetical protein
MNGLHFAGEALNAGEDLISCKSNEMDEDFHCEFGSLLSGYELPVTHSEPMFEGVTLRL